MPTLAVTFVAPAGNSTPRRSSSRAPIACPVRIADVAHSGRVHAPIPDRAVERHVDRRDGDEDRRQHGAYGGESSDPAEERADGDTGADEHGRRRARPSS